MCLVDLWIKQHHLEPQGSMIVAKDQGKKEVVSVEKSN